MLCISFWFLHEAVLLGNWIVCTVHCAVHVGCEVSEVSIAGSIELRDDRSRCLVTAEVLKRRFTSRERRKEGKVNPDENMVSLICASFKYPVPPKNQFQSSPVQTPHDRSSSRSKTCYPLPHTSNWLVEVVLAGSLLEEELHRSLLVEEVVEQLPFREIRVCCHLRR